MSKLSPTGQSMAALFSPEGEKLRRAQKNAGTGTAGASGTFRVPGGAPGTKGSSKSGDGSGDGNTPGYEKINWKKTGAAQDSPTAEEAAPSPASQGFEAPEVGPQFIRLGLGWDKLLMTQKKICEKARGLFTVLEGPLKYRGQRKSSWLEAKARGAILNVDLQEANDLAMEQKKKEQEEKDKEAA